MTYDLQTWQEITERDLAIMEKELSENLNKYESNTFGSHWEFDDDVILTPPPLKDKCRVTCKVVKVEK